MEPFALANKTQEYDEAQTLNVKQLGAGATVFWNLQTQQNAELTLTQNVTFAAPSGWKNGRMMMVEIIQGGAGSFTVAWNSMFINISSLTMNTTAGYSNVLIFKCVLVSGKPKVMLVSNGSSTRA